MKIVIVTGGRGYNNRAMLRARLAEAQPDMVVHGGCPSGADMLADLWAQEYQIPCLSWPARWNEHGRAAGPIRNRDMIDWITDVEVGFKDWWDKDCEVVGLVFPGGRGTADCKSQLVDFDIPFKEIKA